MLMQTLDERLLHALDHLGEEKRQCFLLRIVDGFLHEEIASMLALPIGTVMSHIHRARIKLRDQLAAMAVEKGLTSN